MSFWQDFKAFALRGNIIDFAVGIIIGAAFGKIVSSFVTDILMPPLGLFIGNVDFNSLSYTLKNASFEHEAVVIRYGLFINTIIDFIIIALAIFLLIKILPKKEGPASSKLCPECQMSVPKLARRCGHCTSVL